MSFDFDPEVPAGYQEADIMMAQYAHEDRVQRTDRANGICWHNSQLGPKVPAFYGPEDVQAMRAAGDFPDRPTATLDQAAIPAGQCLCLDCGELVEGRF